MRAQLECEYSHLKGGLGDGPVGAGLGITFEINTKLRQQDVWVLHNMGF